MWNYTWLASRSEYVMEVERLVTRLQTTQPTSGGAVTVAAVQIVSNLPAPSNGGPIYRFWACGPAGWLSLLLTKAGDVETNPGPTTLNKKVWICDICHKQIHVRKQISIRCNRIEHWVHQLVYSPNYYIQIFQTQLFACSEDWTLNLLARSYQVQRAYQLRYGSYINESLHHMKQPHPLKTDHLAIVITLDSKKKYKWYYELTKNKLKLPFPVLYVNYHFPWI